MFGGKITKTQVKQLLTKGITAKKLKLATKDGKAYEARLGLHAGVVKIEGLQTPSPQDELQQ